MGREEERKLDNLSCVAPGELERKWLFHGSDARTLDKICATGFNRSFCGKNATMCECGPRVPSRFTGRDTPRAVSRAVGKGVYFARDSGYSTHTTYSRPDQNGVQRMLLCRVLLASYTLGIKDAIVPLERDGGILFDSTVNNLADPSIFVVYHDAQAYPEYRISFRRG